MCLETFIEFLPPFPDFDPNRENHHDDKSPNESAEHEDIAIVGVVGKAEELRKSFVRLPHSLITAIDSQASL